MTYFLTIKYPQLSSFYPQNITTHHPHNPPEVPRFQLAEVTPTQIRPNIQSPPRPSSTIMHGLLIITAFATVVGVAGLPIDLNAAVQSNIGATEVEDTSIYIDVPVSCLS